MNNKIISIGICILYYICLVSAFESSNYNYISPLSNLENKNQLSNTFIDTKFCTLAMYDIQQDVYWCYYSGILRQYYSDLTSQGYFVQSCSFTLSNTPVNIFSNSDYLFYMYYSGLDTKIRKIYKSTCIEYPTSQFIDDYAQECIGIGSYVYCLCDDYDDLYVIKYDNSLIEIDRYTCIGCSDLDYYSSLRYSYDDLDLYLIQADSSGNDVNIRYCDTTPDCSYIIDSTNEHKAYTKSIF